MKMRSIVFVGFGTAVAIWACDMPTSYTCTEAHTCPRGGEAGATATGTGIGGASSTTTVNEQGGAIGTNTYAGGSGGALPCSGTCSGLTPICDAASNKCVGCVSSSSCTASPNNVCDPSSASCVECVASGDCKDASKHVCKTAAKTCVECVANADCAGKMTLQGTAGSPGTAGAPGIAGAPGLAGAAGAPSSSNVVQTKSVCDVSSNVCVGCLQNADCAGTPATPFCNKDRKQCVACLQNADCTNAGMSRCDLTSNTCAPCAVDDDCKQISGKQLCVSGTVGQANRCVECTVANEGACNGNSCNPKTNACTATVKGSRKTCQSCLADSECGTNEGVQDPNSRCIPMTFHGAPHGDGGYCLLRREVAPCANPYVVLTSNESLSGVASAEYCGVNQNATTCEAVLDLAAMSACMLDTDCGDGVGGLCKTSASLGDLRCTIPCGSSAECLSGGVGNTCSGSTNGYCK